MKSSPFGYESSRCDPRCVNSFNILKGNRPHASSGLSGSFGGKSTYHATPSNARNRTGWTVASTHGTFNRIADCKQWNEAKTAELPESLRDNLGLAVAQI
jgi:hypothetical protein